MEAGSVLSSSSSAASSDFDAFLPKAGAIYEFSENASLGFTVQKAHRAGGSAVNNVTGEPYGYDPENAWNYELSWKRRSPEGAYLFALNAFLMDWQDQQINVPQVPGDFTSDIVLNAGESRVYGLEAEVSARPVKGLQLAAGLGLAKTEFQEFSFVQFGSLLDLAGEPFPQAPELSASVSADYTFAEGWFVGGDLAYTDSALSRSILEGGPRDEMPSYTIANLRGGWRKPGWDVVLFVDNAFDKDYFLYRYDTPGFQLATMGQSRSYGVQATWRY